MYFYIYRDIDVIITRVKIGRHLKETDKTQAKETRNALYCERGKINK